MSFILNPFIFEILENFYERELMFLPYTTEFIVSGGLVETQTLHMIPYTMRFITATESVETQTLHLTPYNMIAHPVDLSNESYKILNILYNTAHTIATSSIETQTLHVAPYTTEFIVSSAIDDPSSIDPSNIILLLDGDKNLDGNYWQNQVGDLASMSFSASPTYSAAGVNGHGTIRFSGVFNSGDNGIITTPKLEFAAASGSHEYTTYFVFYQHSIVGNRYIFDDGVNTNRHRMLQVLDTGSMFYAVNAAGGFMSGSNEALKWFILSANIAHGLNSGSVRTYIQGTGDSIATGNFNDSNDLYGVCLAGANAVAGECNVEFAYVMFRTGSDSYEMQSSIFDAMKHRFDIF